jgi:lysophospholipase L1-like esterase
LPGALAAMCDAAGIPFLDLAPALHSAAAAGRLPYFAADTHLNSAGHEVVAEAALPWIRSLLKR